MANSFTPQQIEQFLQEFFDVVGARQYVGARYVPIFGRAGEGTVEWDNLAPYEPLTVVMHEGISYVSRRYVPTGIQITNTDYWVQTYRFNAQVEQYRQEVLAFDGRITANANAIQAEHEARETAIAGLSDTYIAFPDGVTYPKYGTLGQVLATLANGDVRWEDPVIVTSEIAGPLIEEWLDDHPEATTTVQDGSITTPKFYPGAPFRPTIAYTTDQSCDLDDLTTPGIYSFAIAADTAWDASWPTQSETGWVVVQQVPDTTVLFQTFVTFITGSVYTRALASGVWTPWANQEDINFAAGKAFTAPTTYVDNQSCNLDELVTPGIYTFVNNQGAWHESWPSEEVGILTVTKVPSANVWYQRLFTWSSARQYIRAKLPGGTFTDWWEPFSTGTAFMAPVQYTPNQSCDLDTLTVPGIYTFGYDSQESYDDSFPAETIGTLTVTQPQGSVLRFQEFTGYYDGVTYMRFRFGNGTYSPWIHREDKDISILFVGNSLTQDGVAYLPYFLKTYYPEIKFKLYIYFNGGFDLGQQYDQFVAEQNCHIFSVAENARAWTNYSNNRNMKTVLATTKFDIVCMQEYFNVKASYTQADLVDWNNCRDYITSNYQGGNSLEFVSMFHAPARNDATNIFNLTETGNALILEDTISQDMIPMGIAIYRAMSTSLDSLGDQGHLSPDGVHAQEGLPCLLQTFVVALWILERLGINKSIYGSPCRMTTAIYNTLNVPGPHLGTGVIQGTDAQNLLAQEVAIKAYKEGKKFVNTNLSAY